jgi:S1-C subfamily serine protease
MPKEKYVDAADKDSMMGFGRGAGTGGSESGVSLGVIPDYSGDDQAQGVKINGTKPGSGAEASGLKSGDIIVQWNDRKLDSLQQMQNFLDAGKPGETVKLGVMRDGKRIDLAATLHERK